MQCLDIQFLYQTYFSLFLMKLISTYFLLLSYMIRLVENDNPSILQIFNRIPARGNANNEYRLQVFIY